MSENNQKLEEVLKKFRIVAQYVGEHNQIFYGEDNIKFTKKDLKSIENAISEKYKATKKTKRVKSGKKKEITATYMSDQIIKYLNDCNFGIGIADFLRLHGYTGSLTDDGSNKKIQEKVIKFLKDKKLYTECKTYYGEIFGKKLSDADINSYIDLKKQMTVIFEERISSGSLNLSLISFVDKIRNEHNEVNKSRCILSESMKEHLLNTDQFDYYIDGEKIESKKSHTTNVFDFLLESQKVKESKFPLYIPEDNAENGEFGYLHGAVMKIYSFFNVPKEDLSSVRQENLNKPETKQKLELLQSRIKAIKGDKQEKVET